MKVFNLTADGPRLATYIVPPLEEVKAFAAGLELNSCPFCGGAAEAYVTTGERESVVVRCSRCGAMTTREAFGGILMEGEGDRRWSVYDALKASAARWNRRTEATA